jgi:hypothetical protein
VITNTTGQSAFHITELEVFEQGTATNVAAAAAGATASASSTGWGTQPSWAIDGGTNGAFGANSTWHDLDGQAGDDPTQIDQLSVDFAGLRTVDSFRVWGRTDCCPERDDSIRVEFYNGGSLVGVNDTGITTGFDTGLQTIVVPEPGVATMLAGWLLLGLFRRRIA